MGCAYAFLITVTTSVAAWITTCFTTVWIASDSCHFSLNSYFSASVRVTISGLFFLKTYS